MMRGIGMERRIKPRYRNGRGTKFFLFAHMFYPLLLFLIFWVCVNFTSLFLAFEKTVDGVKTFAGLENFEKFLSKLNNPFDEASISLKNTVKFNLINYVITLPLYFIFSYYIFKKFPGTKMIKLLVMIPQAFSSFIISILFLKLMGEVPRLLTNTFGMTDVPNFLFDDKYVLGVQIFYCIWTGFAMGLIIYPNAMRAIPKELLESAQIDGAGMWHEFFNIIMPLIFPTFVTSFVTSIAGFFGASGALVLFYSWNAPTSASLMGYYMDKMILNAANVNEVYPVMAAGGLIFTAIAAPLTFGVKAILDKICPSVEY